MPLEAPVTRATVPSSRSRHRSPRSSCLGGLMMTRRRAAPHRARHCGDRIGAVPEDRPGRPARESWPPPAHGPGSGPGPPVAVGPGGPIRPRSAGALLGRASAGCGRPGVAPTAALAGRRVEGAAGRGRALVEGAPVGAVVPGELAVHEGSTQTRPVPNDSGGDAPASPSASNEPSSTTRLSTMVRTALLAAVRRLAGFGTTVATDRH